MIIKCTECAGKVSDKAAACPHCGAVVTTTSEPVKYDPAADYATNTKPAAQGDAVTHSSYFLPSFLIGLIAAGLWSFFGDGTAGFGNASWAQGFFNAAVSEGMGDSAWAAAWFGSALIAFPAGLVTGIIGMMFERKS